MKLEKCNRAFHREGAGTPPAGTGQTVSIPKATNVEVGIRDALEAIAYSTLGLVSGPLNKTVAIQREDGDSSLGAASQPTGE